MDKRRRLRVIDGSSESPDLGDPAAAADPTAAAASPGDDLLMLLAASGDQAAFARLVDRYQPAIRRTCSILLNDADEAREAAQEVFLRLWGMRERYRAEGRLKYLLYAIARNHCRILRRKQRLQALFGRSEPTAGDDRPAEGAGAELLLARSQMRTLVARAVQQLPEKFRVPLTLRFSDEMPYEEIAVIIGRTPSAARSRVHYGLQQLARRLPAEVFP